MHVKRKHKMTEEIPVDEPMDNTDDTDDYLPPIGDVLNPSQCAPPHVMLSAAYLLSLEADNRLTHKGIDSVVCSTSDLLHSQMAYARHNLTQKLSAIGCPLADDELDSVMPNNCFDGLETTDRRRRFYRQNLNLIEPREVYLGTTLVKSRSRIVAQRKCGVIVPFEDNLKALLAMPEVWHAVQHVHTTHNCVMRDVCDGSVCCENELFTRNPSALQIFLNTDDIEVVNPIGAHVKKHKLSMFYFTLGNIPPQHRSKLTSIQLLAIAKTKDVRKFGVSKLLDDFLCTVNKLASGGIVMELHGSKHLIEGTLLLVCADTPAAHWLGGFKEGVGFSRKACRCCNASAVSMKVNFTANSFCERTLAEHMKRCTDLECLSKDAVKYWSREWGINAKSCLCNIPHFDLCMSFVQDPMHLLLEGVIPYELKLFLCFAVFDAKYFTVEWLNVQLLSFSYTYLETDKPEPILRGDLLSEGKLKQTSAAILTLCKTLPYIVGVKLPNDCEKWINFLRLLQITFLATCPAVTVETAGHLSQLVATHHTLFTKHYPKASVTPKMHYLVHLPNQLLRFGPLRNHWCLRFEAKHGYFKALRLKCFKNLPLTLAKKHQLWMCYKQLGPLGSRSKNYLYEGDLVREGVSKELTAEYPSLVAQFAAILNCSDDSVYVTDSIKVNGIEYRQGCAIVLSYDFSGLPQFVVMRDMFVHNDVKFFVVEELAVDHFNPQMLCYVVEPSSVFRVVRYVELRYPWPLSLHSINGHLCVINVYGHVCEFLM